MSKKVPGGPSLDNTQTAVLNQNLEAHLSLEWAGSKQSPQPLQNLAVGCQTVFFSTAND